MSRWWGTSTRAGVPTGSAERSSSMRVRYATAATWSSRTTTAGSPPPCRASGGPRTEPDVMPGPLPFLRVDHVSIAVREMGPALAFFRRLLPIRMREAPRPGYDGQFTWADFFVGDRKIELIESARSGSFVDRFIARRGEGFHHLSLDVQEQRLDDHVALLAR